MPTNGGGARAVSLRALRGALVGLAVWGAFSLAFVHAERKIIAQEAAHPVDNGVGILVAIMYTGILLGCPLSYLTGLLVAWAVRLHRPWAVSLLGLLFTAVLVLVIGCAYAPFAPMGRGPTPSWVPVLLIVAPYTLVAMVPLGGPPAPTAAASDEDSSVRT
jgi:hypothetical protein